jgi:hypothetical protein
MADYIIEKMRERSLDMKIRHELKKARTRANPVNNQANQAVPRRGMGFFKKLFMAGLFGAAAYGGYYAYQNNLAQKVMDYFNSRTENPRNEEPAVPTKINQQTMIDYPKLAIVERPQSEHPKLGSPEEEILNAGKVGEISRNYNLIVNDESIKNPFIISSDLVEVIKKHTGRHNGEGEKAKALYEWVESNIKYGNNKRTNGYKNSEEVIEQKEGVCGEMAFLYVTMARCCGLKSNYVSVKTDYKGKSVAHACASVNVDGKQILVDPAYHEYDIKHREFKILTDKEAVEKFTAWRKDNL